MLGSKLIVVIGISKRIAKEGNFDKFISFAIQCEGIDEPVNVCGHTFSFLIYRKGHRFFSYSSGWYHRGGLCLSYSCGWYYRGGSCLSYRCR